MDTRQFAPYFQALEIIKGLEAKAIMLETLPGQAERIAAIRAKIEAKKAALPPAPPEPENHTAPIVEAVEAKVDAAAISGKPEGETTDMTDEAWEVPQKPSKKRAKGE